MTLLFGVKLRYLRRERHWTQADLAHQLEDVGRAHVGNVETSSRPPSLLFVLRTARLFQTTTDYLVRDTIPINNAASHGLAFSPSQTALPSQFGAKLRHLRQQHGLSQVELSKQLGLSGHTHISFLERGRHEPSIDLVVAIADRFGVSTDYLLWDDLITESG